MSFATSGYPNEKPIQFIYRASLLIQRRHRQVSVGPKVLNPFGLRVLIPFGPRVLNPFGRATSAAAAGAAEAGAAAAGSAAAGAAAAGAAATGSGQRAAGSGQRLVCLFFETYSREKVYPKCEHCYSAAAATSNHKD